MRKRVVITGLGVISAIGNQLNDFWSAALSGKSGVSEVDLFDTSEYASIYGGQIKTFDPSEYLTEEEIQTLGRSSQYALSSARQAVEDSVIDFSSMDLFSTGVIMGSTMGEIKVVEKLDKDIAADKYCREERLYKKLPAVNISQKIGQSLGITGDNLLLPNACAAGNFSIGYGFDLISSGKKKAILAGGTDPFSEIAFKGFSKLRSYASDACRPFDKNRKGIIVGEGAASLILEEYEHAKKRNAKIYAELLGYGASCDSYHMIMPYPDGRGIIMAMQKAIKNSGISPGDVDYISAHGTGTPVNDSAETLAVKKVFKDHADNISISSLKSMLGHPMGAASALEAVVCCMAVKNDVIPPTINYETFDPECDLDIVPNKCKNKKVNIAFNNAYAFGGNNISIVFKKFIEDQE